ncbi:MAG TPA: type II secretion system F family protein [Candidatus Dormibacteraeota bacterium]
MNLSLVEIGFAAAAATGTAMLLGALAPAVKSDVELVDERLRTYEGHAVQTLAELELHVGFVPRVLVPLLHRISAWITRNLPENVRSDLNLKLTLAGRPGGLTASDFTAIRYGCTGFLALGLLALGVALQNVALAAVLTLLGGAIGLYGPIFWLKHRISVRKREIQTSLPDALDLMIVAVEAGLGFEAAMGRYAEKVENALATEFARLLRETRLGRPRLEALEDLGRRSGVEDVNNFVQAVMQAEQLGSGITKILNLQGEEIRRRRVQRAQEQGAKAPLKMLLPMVGCIFPTLWIILLGPSALLLMDAMSKR